jgi:hypothetical protein
MKNKLSWDLSVISLIIFNLVPLFGIIFFDWSLFSVIFLYWSENLVIGFYNVLKMLKAQRVDIGNKVFEQKENNKKSYLVSFFIFHYSMFTLVQGLFVLAIFYEQGVSISGILIAIISLFVSHGISYFENFLKKEEYKTVSPGDLFGQPYNRVFIVHMVVLFGGFVISRFSDLSIFPILLLVILKTVTDLKLHQLEHKKFQTSLVKTKC